jgi:hypothetical protein
MMFGLKPMTGNGKRRLRIEVIAGEKAQKRTVGSKRTVIAAFFLSLMFALLIQSLSIEYFNSFPLAFAAGNGNGNGGGAKSNASGEANGNGVGNAKENGNGNANGLNNGITNGNGIGIDLGDGVGLGIGVGDGDTIGVGVGINLGDRPGHRLEKESGHDDLPRWRGREGHGWSLGNGVEKRKADGADILDLGKRVGIGRIDKAFENDIDELSKLLDPDHVDKQEISPGNADVEGRDRAPAGNVDQQPAAANGKSEPPAGVAKATADGNGNGNGNGNAKGNGDANGNGNANGNGIGKGLGKIKEHGNGKALAKGKDKKKDTEDDTVAQQSVSPAAASREGSADTSMPMIGPGSYDERQVLALGLSPAAMARVRQLGFSLSDTGLEQDAKALVTLYAPARLDALAAIALLRREIPRETFQLNRIYRPYNTATKDDLDKTDRVAPGADDRCRGDKCYGKAAIGWKDELAICARDVNVGVIDTDVDLKHPTFSGQKITRRMFLADGKQPSPNGHGTGVLALLAGRPDSDTPGLIPEAKFFVANVFFADGNGETITDTVSLLKSLEWMNASQARVINMSFSGPEDELVQVRLKAMRARGFVFTAAAGNEGPAALPTYPAAYPEVIAVTAVTKDKRIYPSANRGLYIDLAAPGVGIWTAMPEIRNGYRTGTSFAAPFATAVLALQSPDLMYAPKDELLDHVNIVRLGSKALDPIYGRGLLQAPSECSSAKASASNLAPATSAIPR